jgi:hypothetical protein
MIVLACSNCVHGDPQPYWFVIALTFPLGAVLLWLLAKRTRTLRSRATRTLALGLGAACALLLFLAPQPILHHMALPNGTICGSALSSSMMRAAAFGGPKSEAFLDPVQAQCKRLGQSFVDQGLKRYELLALLIVTLAGVMVIADARERSHRRLPPNEVTTAL